MRQQPRSSFARLAIRSITATVLAATVTGGAHAAAGPGSASGLAPGRRALDGVVILKLQQRLPGVAKTTGVAAVDAVLARHGSLDLVPILQPSKAPRKPGPVDLTRVYRVRYTDGAPPEAVAAELAQRPDVEYAEPQWTYPLDVVPNDTSYPSQAGYANRMHLPQAWDITKGEQGPVVVALADGGTDWHHPDLLANIWTNPGEIAANGIDDDNNGFIDDVHGWNFANDTNDPTGLPSTPNNALHGTHTAGIVCAVANNSAGIAGASWNAKLMPICVSAASDNSVAFGFAGILYAAENHADVVNCSWGALGSASQFELEVVTQAWTLGTAVVAACGNNSSGQPHYPSAYPHVLSVANVNNFDVKVNSSNFGPTVDVCAQGLNILSTIPGATYDILTGTSMSSPHAAGVCALVKTRWPGYSADQVMERVRVTCDDIDGVNPSRRGQLGKGRVNAEAALTKNTPAVRILSSSYTETDGDGVIEPGETVTLQIGVVNYLAHVNNLTFKLRETSAFATAVDSVATLASLDSLGAAALPPFSFTVSPTAPIQHIVSLILAIDATDPVYTDRDRMSVTVLPTFATQDANNVVASVTSVGKFGFSVAAGGNGADGNGFSYKGSANLLYEGALLAGTGTTKISDSARGATAASDEDFSTVVGGTPHILQPGPLAPQQTTADFTDAIAESPLPIKLHQDTYEWVDAVHDDYILVRYMITNTGATALAGFRIGWFCDWDVDGGTYNTNSTGFDAARDLGYVYDTGTGPTSYIGTRVLNAEGATSYRGIWNDPAFAPDWGVYDGFLVNEKWDCLAGGLAHPEAGPSDISTAIATGPFTVQPGDSIEVGFAFVGGDDLADLRINADAAALKWQHLHSGTPVTLFDLTAEQEGDDVVLHWRTRDERDITAFRIFRGRDFGSLTALAPDIAPNPERSYAFRDKQPESGSWIYRVGAVAADGSVQLYGSTGIHVGGALPGRAFLDPAVPNPFNPSTVLRFGVATRGPLAVDVYDARGHRVRSLLHEPDAQAGFRRLVWDGRDDTGRALASGVYVVRMQTSGSSLTRRVTLLK